MKFVLFLLLVTITTLVYGAPATTEPESPPTQSPTTSPQGLQKQSQSTSRASLESWQSATILLRHIEDVILAGYEVPPSPTCFQEERDPLTYEHPPPNTDFQAFLEQDYNSLLRYRDYFSKVSNTYGKQLSSTATSSPEEEAITHSKAMYIIELGDFISSLNSLLKQMEKLLNALSATATTEVPPTTSTEVPPTTTTEVPPTTSTLPSECYEICYGQQVSVLEDYLILAYTYIPRDISRYLDSKNKN